MDEYEDFILTEVYTPTDDEKADTAAALVNPPAKGPWESKREGVLTFKENIKDFLYERQNGLCAYCRCEISRATSDEHIEHIVDKNGHKQWTFLPKNLCMACTCCNSPKNNQETLANPATANYPTDSAGFIIINPYYDKYSDHIELVDGVLYRAKLGSVKGDNTISFCHLHRYDLAVTRAKNKITTENQGTFLGDMLALLATNANLVNEHQRFINDITTHMKIWKRKNPQPFKP